jgi:ABC-type Fe3+/spermidine/putrescine transport system ATPase subunit
LDGSPPSQRSRIRREIGAVPPHMNVFDNIGYGLRVRRVAKTERRA